jgi:diguanylate cyclase (GGDEF)-like protein
MNDTSIAGIIEHCMKISQDASKIYQILSSNAETDALKTFWENFSEDSARHLDFWKKLLNSAQKGILPHVFENPKNTVDELNGLHEKILQLKHRSQSIQQTADAFLIAFKLEFYLLHPAFETLFQYLKTLSDERTPADDSNAHLSQLFESLYQYDLVTIELELLGETLHRLWQENRKLAIQNNYDPLTGVLNRRGLFNAIKHLSHLAQRNGNNVGIMMIDIDDFKRVNDTYGHMFGDRVLKYVAETLKENIRASDVLGRYGGEEFLVYLSDIEPGALFGVGDKMRHAVQNTNKDKGQVTISIGLAQDKISDNVEKELNRLINQADEKLLTAKNSGKNTVVV